MYSVNFEKLYNAKYVKVTITMTGSCDNKVGHAYVLKQYKSPVSRVSYRDTRQKSLHQCKSPISYETWETTTHLVLPPRDNTNSACL